MRRIRRRQAGDTNRNEPAGDSARDDVGDEAGDEAGGQRLGDHSTKSSQRVRDHALRVMRATRQRLDNTLLERAQQAIIENAMAEAEDEAGQNYAYGENAPIDKRKNLKTIQTLLEKHSTSQDMQRNIAAMLQDVRRD